MGDINFHLGRQLASYAREDTDPSRVCTTPISILQCLDKKLQGDKSQQQAIEDLEWIALLFLLNPGKHFQGGIGNVSTPFHLQDIQFYVDRSPFPAKTATPHTCETENFVSLLFTTYKNVTKG